MLWNHAPKTASLTVQPVPNLQSQRFDYYPIVNRINIPTGSNRQNHGQTIHPKEHFISMNLFKILCVLT